MSAARAVVLASVLAASACTSFDALDRGVCGNGLVEAGEDCDSSEARCVRCAVTCTTAAECPHAGYACGVDGVCHAPGGVLGAAVPAGPFQVTDVAIEDLDRDGIGDAIGVSRTSIAIHHGEPGGRLDRVETVITPAQIAPPTFSDLDGDGTTDVAIATPDGLVSYGSPFGTLAPMPVRSDVIEGGILDVRHILRVSALTAGVFFADNGRISLGVIDLSNEANSTLALPCAARLGSVSPSAFSSAKVDFYAVSQSDAVISIAFETSPRALCVLALRKPLLFPWTVTDITPANAPGLARRATLADLESDADACPGLVNSDGGGGDLRYWDGRMAATGCVLDPGSTPAGSPLPAASSGDVAAVGRVPLKPAFPGLAADMLVLTDGVYAVLPPGSILGPPALARLYASVRPLASALHTDFDLDGLVDAVLVPASEDDVDVLFRRPNAFFPAIPGYVVYRVDTASPVVRAELGDFDGNGRDDLALLEQLTGYQRLVVAFADSDYFSPPVAVATFEDVIGMASAPIPSSEDLAAATDDLLLIQPPAAGAMSSSLTVLSGSAQRTLIAFFDPRSTEGGDPSDRDRTRFVGTFAGAGAGPGPRSLFAVAIDQRPHVTLDRTPPQVWRMDGTPSGPAASVTAPLATTGLADCSGTPVVGSGLCVDDAIVLAWPGPAGQDAAIAIDRAQPAHAARIVGGAMVTATALPALAAALPAAASVRALSPADLDGDGVLDLVVAATPREAAGTGALVVCAMADGVPQACEDLMPAIVAELAAQGEPPMACVDAAPARIRARGPFDGQATPVADDLVVVCGGDTGSTIFRVERGAGLVVTPLARSPLRLARLHVGDVTGDGLDDVLAIEGDSGARSLVVFPQCSSRDAVACGRGAGGGS